ncbi:Rod shape-determining protein RodA [Candidatus Hepatincolaceae symbiont of Richtersius coronifer]
MLKNFTFSQLNFFRISDLSKILVALLLILCALGGCMQYSAGGGTFIFAYPYVFKVILGFIVLIIVSKIDLKLIFILVDAFYVFSVLLLILLAFIGATRLGAQRWIDLGLFAFQPSEIMKIAIILMLAKHFHKFSVSQVGKLRFYISPVILIIIPFLLVLREPDLGTALIILIVSSSMFFLAGFKIKYFLVILAGIIIFLPIAWMSLYPYQKERVLTFLNPDRDPLNSGYHIIQSKIAIGSGGFAGKGYLSGTQGQLDFLPEKHTDFIFTLLSEEFGLLGGLFLIILYMGIIFTCTLISYHCPYNFGRYVTSGIITIFFTYIFVNIGMVSGLLPVVGIPLPFISFGGTSMLTYMIGFGLILNIENNKDYT